MNTHIDINKTKIVYCREVSLVMVNVYNYYTVLPDHEQVHELFDPSMNFSCQFMNLYL